MAPVFDRSFFFPPPSPLRRRGRRDGYAGSYLTFFCLSSFVFHLLSFIFCLSSFVFRLLSIFYTLFSPLTSLIAQISSPDCSGKPFAVLLYFFLAKKSDQRRLFFGLRKKQQDKQAWNGKRDWLLIN